MALHFIYLLNVLFILLVESVLELHDSTLEVLIAAGIITILVGLDDVINTLKEIKDGNSGRKIQ